MFIFVLLKQIIMKKVITILAAALAICACSSTKKTAAQKENGFPAFDQGGKIAIVAHRGFWDCEAAGHSENSIASLKAAQDNGFWGSEFDVHLTSDDVVIVNHDGNIDGLKIQEHTYAELKDHLLPNGEHRPTIDEYLVQGAKSKKTVLVLELKSLNTPEREDLLVDKSIAALKTHGLYKPDRVAFISFSKHICERVAELCPEFTNQYLNGELGPDALAKLGINGFDYHQKIVSLGKSWVDRAHELGMSTNVWTVNKEKDLSKMIEIGVDAITTNAPLLARELLGEREYRK